MKRPPLSVGSVRMRPGRAYSPVGPVTIAVDATRKWGRRSPDGARAFVGADHDCRLAAVGVRAHFDGRRATWTMAALTARIDRRPTHCRVSPIPSPQYVLEGPTS